MSRSWPDADNMPSYTRSRRRPTVETPIPARSKCACRQQSELARIQRINDDWSKRGESCRASTADVTYALKVEPDNCVSHGSECWPFASSRRRTRTSHVFRHDRGKREHSEQMRCEAVLDCGLSADPRVFHHFPSLRRAWGGWSRRLWRGRLSRRWRMGRLSRWMGRLSKWILWCYGGFGGVGFFPYLGYGYSGYGGYAGYSGYGGYGNAYTDPSYPAASYPSFTYSSGYSVAPAEYTFPGASTPYLTSHTYEPGDGYRYPLYYNPNSGQHVYYPVTK